MEFASIIVNNSMGDAVKPSDDAVTIRFNAVASSYAIEH